MKKNRIERLKNMRGIYLAVLLVVLASHVQSKFSYCDKFTIYYDQYYTTGELVIGINLHNEKQTIYLTVCHTEEACKSGLDRINGEFYDYANKLINNNKAYKSRFSSTNQTTTTFTFQNSTFSVMSNESDTRTVLRTLTYNRFVTLNSKALNLFRFDKTSTRVSIVPIQIGSNVLPVFYKQDVIDHKGCRGKIELFVIPELESKPSINGSLETFNEYPSMEGIVVDIEDELMNRVKTDSHENVGQLGLVHPLVPHESDLYVSNSKGVTTYETDPSDRPADGIIDLSSNSPIWTKYSGYVITQNELIMVDREQSDFKMSKRNEGRNFDAAKFMDQIYDNHQQQKTKTMDEHNIVSYFSNYREWMNNEYSIGVLNWFKKKYISRLFFRIDQTFDPRNRTIAPQSSGCGEIQDYNTLPQPLDENMYKSTKGLLCTFNVEVQGDPGWTLCIDTKRIKSFIPNFLAYDKDRNTNSTKKGYKSITIDFKQASCIDSKVAGTEKTHYFSSSKGYNYNTILPATKTAIKLRDYTTFNRYHVKIPSDLKLIIWGLDEYRTRTKIIVHEHDLFARSGVGFAVALSDESLYEDANVNMHAVEVVVVIVCFLILMRNATANKTFLEICVFYTNLFKKIVEIRSLDVTRIYKKMGILNQIVDTRRVVPYSTSKTLPMFKKIYRIHPALIGTNTFNWIVSFIMFVVYLSCGSNKPGVNLFWIWMSLYVLSITYLFYDCYSSLVGVFKYNRRKLEHKRRESGTRKRVTFTSVFYKTFCDTFIDFEAITRRRSVVDENILTRYRMAVDSKPLEDAPKQQEKIDKELTAIELDALLENEDFVYYRPINSMLSDFSSIFVSLTTIVMTLWWNTTDIWNWSIVVIIVLCGCQKTFESVINLVFMGIDSILFSITVRKIVKREVSSMSIATNTRTRRDYYDEYLPMHFLDAKFVCYVLLLATMITYAVLISYYGTIEIIMPLFLSINDKYSDYIVACMVTIILIVLFVSIVSRMRDKMDNIAHLKCVVYNRTTNKSKIF